MVAWSRIDLELGNMFSCGDALGSSVGELSHSNCCLWIPFLLGNAKGWFIRHSLLWRPGFCQGDRIKTKEMYG